MFIDKDCFEYQILGTDFGHKDRLARFKTVIETMAHSQISLGFQGWADCSISSADFKTVELSVGVPQWSCQSLLQRHWGYLTQ
jgi:hypothetical protein